MIEQKKVVIGGEELLIESLPSTAALQLLVKIVKIVGGAGLGVSDIPSSKKEVEQALHLGNIVQGLLDKIDVVDTPQLIKSVIEDSLVRFRDRPGTFEDWYAGRFSRKLMDQFQLFYAILDYNYGEPIELLKKLWGESMEQETGTAEPPPES